MAASLLLGRTRPLATIGLTAAILAHPAVFNKSRIRPHLCEAAAQPVGGISYGERAPKQDGKVKSFKEVKLNAQTITQFSMGSVLGKPTLVKSFKESESH